MDRPYQELMGISIAQADDGPPICQVAFGEHVEGRPSYLHGGAIAGLLETAAYVALEHTLRDQPQRTAKPIGIGVEYMRNGMAKQSFARGRVLRVGSRIADVAAEAWQDDPARPIAAARMRFSIRD